MRSGLGACAKVIALIGSSRQPYFPNAKNFSDKADNLFSLGEPLGSMPNDRSLDHCGSRLSAMSNKRLTVDGNGAVGCAAITNVRRCDSSVKLLNLRVTAPYCSTARKNAPDAWHCLDIAAGAVPRVMPYCGISQLVCEF